MWIGDSIRNNVAYAPCTAWLPVTRKGKGEMGIRCRDAWDLTVCGELKGAGASAKHVIHWGISSIKREFLADLRAVAGAVTGSGQCGTKDVLPRGS